MKQPEIIKRQGELLLQVDNLAKKREVSHLFKLELAVYEILDRIIEEIEKPYQGIQ